MKYFACSCLLSSFLFISFVHADTVSVSSLSRDTGSTAGGTVLTITGSGFTPSTNVSFGGTAALVSYIDSSDLQVTVPAHSTGVVDVTADSGTLAGAFTYLPAPTVIEATNDFEEGTLSPYQIVDGSTVSIVNTVAHSGTHSVLSIGNTGGVNEQYGIDLVQSDIVGGTGRYHRWYFMIPAATLSYTSSAGQIKMFLSRTGVSNHFIVIAEGRESLGTTNNLFGALMDQDNIHFQTVQPPITPDVWHEVQVYEYRDPVAHLGTAKVWYDGKLIGQATDARLGDDDPTLIRGASFGMVYTQNATGYPIQVYTDDTTIANGFIDPVNTVPYTAPVTPPPVTPPPSSGGTSISGTILTTPITTPAPIVATTPLDDPLLDLVSLITANRALFEKAQSLGITLPPLIEKVLTTGSLTQADLDSTSSVTFPAPLPSSTPSSSVGIPVSSTPTSHPSLTLSSITRPLQLNYLGTDVILLQNFLIQTNAGPEARALAQHGANGSFGPLTQGALIEYQQSIGVPETGVFDTRTKAGR